MSEFQPSELAAGSDDSAVSAAGRLIVLGTPQSPHTQDVLAALRERFHVEVPDSIREGLQALRSDDTACNAEHRPRRAGASWSQLEATLNQRGDARVMNPETSCRFAGLSEKMPQSGEIGGGCECREIWFARRAPMAARCCASCIWALSALKSTRVWRAVARFTLYSA